MSDERHDDDGFFIGWATASPRTVRTSTARAVAMSLVVVALGALAAGSMRSPGAGLSPFRASQSLVGLLVDGPTPMLLVLDETRVGAAGGAGGAAPDGRAAPLERLRPRVVLLSSMGRTGPDPSVLGHAGEIVRLTGNLLERDGRRMIEVGGVEAASLAPEVESLLRAVRREPAGHTTLRGELVDSKCYLGRMRPGAGRTHRACAQSCVGGGVTPILVTHGDDGIERHYALEGVDGSSVRLELLPFLTEPVEIEGDVECFADLCIVHVDVGRIRRL